MIFSYFSRGFLEFFYIIPSKLNTKEEEVKRIASINLAPAPIG